MPFIKIKLFLLNTLILIAFLTSNGNVLYRLSPLVEHPQHNVVVLLDSPVHGLS